MTHDRPRVYFSFRSPFSWLAVERLQRALPHAMEVVDFVPYWEPDAETARQLEQRGGRFHYVTMSKAKHLYILHDVKRLAQKLEMPLAWPVDVDPWWELPHLGWLEASRIGAGATFYSALTKARWECGANICDEKVIRRLADSIGIDAETIVLAANNPELRAKGVECLERAFQDDVFGVPYFRFGWERFWGFDRVDDFLKVLIASLRRAGGTLSSLENEVVQDEVVDQEEPITSRRIPQALQSDVGAYDTDAPGGCG